MTGKARTGGKQPEVHAGFTDAVDSNDLKLTLKYISSSWDLSV